MHYLDLNEKTMTTLMAIEESARCLLCHDAPCSTACPAGTDPAKFIRSIRFRNFEGAVATMRTNNILSECCALVCPYDKYCEGACSRTGIDRPIQIGKLQRYLAQYEANTNLKVLQKIDSVSKEKVAIVGGGPSGLSAAAELAQKGYDVTVFEKNNKAGGWLSYGIPPSRLPQEVIDREVMMVEELGVKFNYNMEIGKDVFFETLIKQGFKAVLIAIGMQKSKIVDIPGITLTGVLKGTLFLHKAKSSGGDVKLGQRVVVVGGGDVAHDCAVSAKLLGASDVKILYRRKLEDMPASQNEKELARKLNIPIFTGFKPVEILGKDGFVTAIKAVGNNCNATSVKAHHNNDGATLTLPCDNVIFAIGQEIQGLENLGNMTEPFVFQTGDIVEGDKTVVYGVFSGKKSANEIDLYLTKKRNKVSVDEVTK
jgi:dihydropyrimidine dehydrogenase (NAD+) subunit PreT